MIAAATTPSESKTIVCGFQDNADPAGLNANAREKVVVDDQYGNYTIYLNPRARLDQLTSDTYRILHNNVWYDSAGKGTFKLKLKEVVVTQPDSPSKKDFNLLDLETPMQTFSRYLVQVRSSCHLGQNA